MTDHRVSEREHSILVVGWGRSNLKRLWSRIAARSTSTFSFVMHPKYTARNWPGDGREENIHFFFENEDAAMPEADRELLASLECPGVPTINNMIMGDRVVSKLSHTDGLMYATYLARRLADLFTEIRPSVVIGGFDAVHSGMTLAIARRMNIPWFAMNFSVIPSGLVCLCDQMNPAARVLLKPPDTMVQGALADKVLAEFEQQQLAAPAYVAPPPLTVWKKVSRLPSRALAVYRTIRKWRRREFLRFVEYRSGHSVPAAVRVLWKSGVARRAIARVQTIDSPPETPYAFFGLHMQPESTVDAWAPFYSNQIWVIELMSRSLPPTHRLLVKIHKSDISNHSKEQLERMSALPGVELVTPTANARSFIERADLIFSIQGTIGLEAALIGKPVIMFGDSPVALFPSASRIGKIHELPELIKRKLTEVAPERGAIVSAFASYLAPFQLASHNDWTRTLSDVDVDNYVDFFEQLRQHSLHDSKNRTTFDKSIHESN